MLDSITLLVTQCPRLIRVVREVHDTCGRRRLVLCGHIERAPLLLQHPDLALVLVDFAAGRSADAYRLLLRAAAKHPRARIAVVPTDPIHCGSRDGLADNGLEILWLPADLRKLGRSLVATGCVPEARAQPPTRYASALECQKSELAVVLRRVAAQDTTILLTGETGTGKTMLARQIHEASPRKDRPFTVVDCGALAASLIESEMFGHVRGAFTGADRERVGKFAAAADGTLILDEINSLPLALQAKLLRAVEERVFEPLGSNQAQPLRARIIAISNVPLDQEVSKERFRADLYYRLNVVGFRLPPLRDRSPDILHLARRFLADHPLARAQGIIGIAPDALRALETYGWPGNVRELKNVVERVAALCTGRIVTLADLPDGVRAPAAPTLAAGPTLSTPPTGGPEDEVWRICEALKKHRNNRLRAAAELGISRVSLYKKLHKYGLFDKAVAADRRLSWAARGNNGVH